MIADPQGRARMAAAARKRLVDSFGMDAGIDRLAARLRARAGIHSMSRDRLLCPA